MFALERRHTYCLTLDPRLVSMSEFVRLVPIRYCHHVTCRWCRSSIKPVRAISMIEVTLSCNVESDRYGVPMNFVFSTVATWNDAPMRQTRGRERQDEFYMILVDETIDSIN